MALKKNGKAGDRTCKGTTPRQRAARGKSTLIVKKGGYKPPETKASSGKPNPNDTKKPKETPQPKS